MNVLLPVCSLRLRESALICTLRRCVRSLKTFRMCSPFQGIFASRCREHLPKRASSILAQGNKHSVGQREILFAVLFSCDRLL